MIRKEIIKSDLILLVTALIWGLAFVAQRMGMEHIGPFTFNAIRFAMGAIVLLPFLFLMKGEKKERKQPAPGDRDLLMRGGLIAGIVLFMGSSFQQYGIVYTTAGNAGFITSLYVIFTPILGLFVGQRPGIKVWIGAFIATIGLYLLSVTGSFNISTGDLLVLISAFFYAIHVLVIGWLSPKFNSIKIALLQFFAVAVMSFVASYISEIMIWEQIRKAAIPILYAGIFSTGLAFTLQIIGQRKTIPSHAAILLSFEAVFAVLGGWVILNESSTLRQIIGCVLMFVGIIIAQYRIKGR